MPQRLCRKEATGALSIDWIDFKDHATVSLSCSFVAFLLWVTCFLMQQMCFILSDWLLE